MVAKICLSLIKNTYKYNEFQVKINTPRYILKCAPRHITAKMLKIKDKNETLRTGKENQPYLQRDTNNKQITSHQKEEGNLVWWWGLTLHPAKLSKLRENKDIHR